MPHHRSRLRVERLECRTVPTADYFRVVSYNIAASDQAIRAGLDAILRGIGDEVVAGRAEPIDVIALQEVQSQATTTQSVVAMLNGIYGAGAYARGNLNVTSTGSGTQGIVYNTQSLQLIGEVAVGTASSAGQPRAAVRYQLRPVGGTAADDIYIYNSHFKANDDTDSEGRRLVEANALRANADALGAGVEVLYVGDFNTYRSSDTSYQRLLSAGNGQAQDPANRPGDWHGLNSFRDIFTQAPSNSPPAGLTGGGLDDRFDFVLASGEFFDGTGLEYVASTYHTFGNNGSVAVNGSINAANSTALPGMANRTTILDNLTTVTDHLPVVADFRRIVPPRVAGVQVNGGAAQRSRVTSLAVTFDAAVTFAGPVAAAFTVSRVSGGSVGGFAASTATVGGVTVVTLNGFTGAETEFGSLADGRFTVRVLASQVSRNGAQLDGNADGTGGDDYTLTGTTANGLFRLFGDANGDGSVSGGDFGLFRLAFGTSVGDPNYVDYFDIDSNGSISGGDFGNFRVRFGTSLP